MGSKLIIENHTSLPDSKVLAYVGAVIDMGRISSNGKQYCYCSTFGSSGQYAVYSHLNKESDRFVVSEIKV